MSDVVSKTLYPKIEVYKGLLPDHKKIFEIIKSTESLTEEDKDEIKYLLEQYKQSFVSKKTSKKSGK